MALLKQVYVSSHNMKLACIFRWLQMVFCTEDTLKIYIEYLLKNNYNILRKILLKLFIRFIMLNDIKSCVFLLSREMVLIILQLEIYSPPLVSKTMNSVQRNNIYFRITASMSISIWSSWIHIVHSALDLRNNCLFAKLWYFNVTVRHIAILAKHTYLQICV